MPRSPKQRRTGAGQVGASRQCPIVLVVDDDAGFRETLRTILCGEFDVRLVGDGRTAVEYVKTHLVDLVLIDIFMPGVDGLEVLVRLKAMKPEVPVIVVSGLDRAAPAAKAMYLGARDYLTKPVEAALLISTATAAVQRRNSRSNVQLTGEVSGRPPHWPIVIVGDDVTTLAGVKLGLMPLAARIAARTASTLQYLKDDRPAFIVIDGGQIPEEIASTVRTVRSAVPKCKLVLACDPVQEKPLRDALQYEGVSQKVDAFLSKPYDFNEVRAWARVAVTPEREMAYRRTLSAHMARAIDYICRDYATATLEAASAAAKVSQGYLEHAFRAELGTTLWDCVTMVRLEVVKDLLIRTPYKLARIAKLTGFCDAPHLSRVFSRYCACSPRCSPRAYRTKALLRAGSDQLGLREPVA